MDFVTPLISTIFGLISSSASGISYIRDLEQNVQSLKNALGKLKDTRDDLKTKVDYAELLGLTSTRQVQRWIESVEAVEAEACLTIQNVEQLSRCFFFCCKTTNCYSSYKVSKKVLNKLKEINLLLEKGTFDVISCEGYLPQAVEEMPSRPTIGLESMLKKVQELLEGEDVGIIGIYGMGGVGKTTLLKSINNLFLSISHNFDVVIWVVVSKDYAADKIQQIIGARLGLNFNETEPQGQRASKLYKIMKAKKFLLLLDDVWEGLDLLKIGIPLPSKENKCKVVFTTRSTNVCCDMDAHCSIKVEFLKEKESWQLFCDKAGRREILNLPSIRHYAEIIVKKCGGLPLVLITMGRAMANKDTEEEWRYAVEVLNNSPSDVRGMEDVFTLLKFSYDNLDNDVLRLCLLYCSLFPEDYSIEKEQLIEYWAGEGFLDGSHDCNAHNLGHALIGSLKVACFLENGEEDSQVKMHDVVRSFALWIASELGNNERRFLVQPTAGLIEAPNVGNWKAAHRISLLDNGIIELSEIPKCPHLTTLLLQWNSGLSRISNGFF